MASKLVNHVVFIVDSSGSMGGLRDQTVKAFNEQLKAVKENADKNNQTTTVSLYTFGGNGQAGVSKKLYRRIASDIFEWTVSDYVPYGNTPMLDAIATAITDLAAERDADNANVSFLLNIITDGEENSSGRTKDVVSALIAQKNATDRWTFAISLPPGVNIPYFARRYNIPVGNCRTWAQTEAGLKETTFTNNASVAEYFSNRSLGQTATKNFYTTDLSKVTTKQLTQKLQDIQDRVNVWNVSKEEEIAPFCARRSRRDYVKGFAYYQLTKTEKIQPHKLLMIREKSTGIVYAGLDARMILGLPNYEVKVYPGNHGNYDIFVQSTSTNRKLVRGSKLIYMKR